MKKLDFSPRNIAGHTLSAAYVVQFFSTIYYFVNREGNSVNCYFLSYLKAFEQPLTDHLGVPRFISLTLFIVLNFFLFSFFRFLNKKEKGYIIVFVIVSVIAALLIPFNPY